MDSFEVGAAINYFDRVSPTAPNPAPGVVTDVVGDNAYTVRITLANDATRTEENVGGLDANPDRYIKAREGGDGGVAPGGGGGFSDGGSL